MKLQLDGRWGLIITLVLLILSVAGFYYQSLTTEEAITTVTNANVERRRC
jgi:uncharacterized protein (UPF0333 family)